MKHTILSVMLLFVTFSFNGLLAQSPTVTCPTTITHNTCGLTNSSVAYTILPSNGWTKFSTVTNMKLYYDNVVTMTSDLVYNHFTYYTGTQNSGVVNGLVPGHYFFQGTITTKGTDGLYYTINFTEHIWVGYNSSWKELNDMFVGSTSNSIVRNATTSGVTYSYAQAYNESASNYGFIHLKKTTNASNSTIYCVLSPITTLSSFLPTGNHTYLEFKTTSGVTTVKLKYYNGSIYTTYTLPVTSSDLIRVQRSTSNIVSLYVNNGTTPISGAPTFTMNGVINPVIYGVELNSEALNVVSSFPCKAEQENTKSYAELQRELDGGYVNTIGGKLRFMFEEEYKIEAGKFIPLRIYDMDHQIKAEVSLNGFLTYQADQTMKLAYDFEDNRRVLPLSNCGCLQTGRFYILEVETSTKEKRYLKFKYN